MLRFPLFLLLATSVILIPLSELDGQEIEVTSFGKLSTGEEAKLYTLENGKGVRVKLSDFGALLVSVETPDRDGKPANVTLSYDSVAEAEKGGVFGNVVGRFANRIDTGGFTIDDTRYDLETVNPKTKVHIHGGKTGFYRQLWEAELRPPHSVKFSLTSPVGHEGYPGKVEVSVTYTLSEEGELTLHYRGSTDKPAHLNLTNHAYFNLSGSGDILNHELSLTCSEVLEVDSRKIPTGKKLPVKDSAFDFRKEKKIGRDIAGIIGGGYDHCFVISEDDPQDQVIHFATLSDPATGRTLDVSTSCPGVQIFTANHFKGEPFPKWGGICFETQYYPDAPNKPEFPSTLLRPGETYEETTVFRFGVSD